MDTVQSVLHPAGPAAAEISSLWWFLFWVGSTVLFIVTVLLLVAALMPRRTGTDEAKPGSIRFVVWGGLIVPAIILLVVLIVALNATLAIRAPVTNLTIEVTGHMWWWEVRYPDHDVVTANEIYVPVDEPVRLVLRSADVIHSFWVPRLHGKMDLLPDVVNTFWIHADRPGTFRGQCAEFCGLQHALMAFLVVALQRDEFDAWISERARPVPSPETEVLLRGREVFFETGCGACHAIAGIGADVEVGPDLTHIGSRLTLGAATVPNTRGNLAGWITNPQPIKPGNRMPPTYLTSEDLHALVEYLFSLQ